MTSRPAVLDEVLRRARATAFAAGEFCGQESFVSAGEVLTLARRAGVRSGAVVLDLCCGRAGPGLHIVRELGCDYMGVDSSVDAIEEARHRARAQGLEVHFEVATVPPLPAGEFDVVLLLETLLAFRDKEAFLREVSAALPLGGRFACTIEEGAALSAAERAEMPASDTVWPIPLEELLDQVGSAGMRVRWLTECTQAHRAAVQALISAYTRSAAEIGAAGGTDALDDLLASHRLWSHWLHHGRIRKFGVVAEKVR